MSARLAHPYIIIVVAMYAPGRQYRLTVTARPTHGAIVVCGRASRDCTFSLGMYKYGNTQLDASVRAAPALPGPEHEGTRLLRGPSFYGLSPKVPD